MPDADRRSETDPAPFEFQEVGIDGADVLVVLLMPPHACGQSVAFDAADRASTTPYNGSESVAYAASGETTVRYAMLGSLPLGPDRSIDG